MKKTKVLVIIAVVLALALGGLGTVLAADPSTTPPARPLNIVGVIDTITPGDAPGQHVIALKTQRGPVQVTTDADTIYKVPGVKEASLANFAAGDTVTVRALKLDSGLLAKAVLKVPGKGLLRQIKEQTVTGKVTSIEGANIILDTPQGAVTVITNNDTKYNVPTVKEATIADIKVGDQITAKGEKTDAGFVAKLVIVLPRPRPGPALSLRLQVTEVSGNTITLSDEAGNTFTINVPQGINIEGVEPGQWVNVTIGDTPPVPAPGQLKHRVRNFFKGWARGFPGHGPVAPWPPPEQPPPQTQTSSTTSYN